MLQAYIYIQDLEIYVSKHCAASIYNNTWPKLPYSSSPLTSYTPPTPQPDLGHFPSTVNPNVELRKRSLITSQAKAKTFLTPPPKPWKGQDLTHTTTGKESFTDKSVQSPCDMLTTYMVARISPIKEKTSESFNGQLGNAGSRMSS